MKISSTRASGTGSRSRHIRFGAVFHDNEAIHVASCSYTVNGGLSGNFWRGQIKKRDGEGTKIRLARREKPPGADPLNALVNR